MTSEEYLATREWVSRVKQELRKDVRSRYIAWSSGWVEVIVWVVGVG